MTRQKYKTLLIPVDVYENIQKIKNEIYERFGLSVKTYSIINSAVSYYLNKIKGMKNEKNTEAKQ